VGGGINGAGIALDAAGRGLKVMLCEMNDLASATSSKSSKLIHGGLRYLEHKEFRLVKEALAEREVLLKKAPHIMNPLRFRLPHRPHLRPAWMIRIGLFLYDHLAKRTTLPRSHSIIFDKHSPVKEDILKGFEYSDGWVDDARLVVLNALGAKDKGAHIATRTRCISAERHGELWQLVLEDQNTGEQQQVKSRLLVNAAGPWVSNFFGEALHTPPPKQVRLIKGSHIIVPRLHQDPEAYILQNEDDRIVFVIPYEEDFSLIGTTDIEYTGDPSKASISGSEEDYLISVVNDHFRTQLSRDDIVSHYSGVRPLLDDQSNSASAVTRDYTFIVDDSDGQPPLLSVFGGKITTYRKLAEVAVNRICEYFPEADSAWTKHQPLPGGEFENQQELTQRFSQHYGWLPVSMIQRFIRAYGTLTHKVLAGCHNMQDMGEHFGNGLYQSEVTYLLKSEWAYNVEDILWRRTKLGLRLSEEEQAHLQIFVKNYALYRN